MYTLTCDKCKETEKLLKHISSVPLSDWLDIRISAYHSKRGTVQGSLLLCPNCTEEVLDRLGAPERAERGSALEEIFLDLVSDIVEDKLSGA